jgi:hypothetical protein
MFQKPFWTTFVFGVTDEREYRYYQGLMLFLHLVALCHHYRHFDQ